jgi:hypothetical protein
MICNNCGKTREAHATFEIEYRVDYFCNRSEMDMKHFEPKESARNQEPTITKGGIL